MSSSMHSSKTNQLLAVYSSGPWEFRLYNFLFIRNPSLLWRKIASNSSILALEIPWTEEPAGLWSIWLHGVSWANMHARQVLCKMKTCWALQVFTVQTKNRNWRLGYSKLYSHNHQMKENRSLTWIFTFVNRLTLPWFYGS